MPWPLARRTKRLSNANEANCDVNCFDESSIPNSGGRPSVLQSGSRLLAAALALLLFIAFQPPPTRGEGWDAQFSDYLLTGQEPRPAVARVVAPDGSGTSLGSGVLVDINASQALVLTNWHVVRDSRSAVLVQFPDGFQSAGTVLRVDATWDLAAIVIWRPNVEPVELAPRAPAIGEMLTIAGYGRGPYREVSGGCTQYLSPGSGQPMELVELVGEARQGDSGGPIFNADGELAGVLFGESGGRTIGASSPRVRAFLASVGSNGYAAPAVAAAASQQPGTVGAAGPSPSSDQAALAATPAAGSPPAAASRPASPLITASLRGPSGEEQGAPPAALAVASQSTTPAVAPAEVDDTSQLKTPSAPPQESLLPEAVAVTDTTATPEPPPLEFADLVTAVQSLAPSGNPTHLLAFVAAGGLILVGLRGITKAMT